jgi:hypothetical protein
MSTSDYYRTFQDAIAALDLNRAWSDPPVQLNPDPQLTGATEAVTRRNIREAQLACHFILNADNRRFSRFKSDLRTNYSRGTDQWPKTVVAAYNLLLVEELHTNASGQSSRNDATGRGPSSGDAGGNRGRHSSRGPPNTSNRTPGAHNPAPPSSFRGHQYHQASRLDGLEHSLLLDTLATHSLLRSADNLRDIRPAPEPLELHTQAGIFLATNRASFHGIPGCQLNVWHSPHAIANVVAMCDVAHQCRVTMDTAQDNAIFVHCPDGSVLRFGQMSNGLYGLTPGSTNTTQSTVAPYSLLQTVSSQMTQFTTRQLRAADAARELSRKLGRPSAATLEHCLTHGHILNCPITVEDVRRADFIYGPDIAFLKGRRTDNPAASSLLRDVPLAPIPQHIALHHSRLTLCIDFFFVQRLPFLHCISRDIAFRHSLAVDNRTHATMRNFVTRTIAEYISRGFDVRAVHADSEFTCVAPDILPIPLHTVTTNGHVPEVERSIRTMKENMRSTVHGMPFRRLPKLLIQRLVHYTTQNLNQLPRPDGGILEHTSPDLILRGRPRPDYNDLSLEFGSYVQILDSSTNTLRARTLGAITLDRTGNADGSYHFLSLRTGRLFTKTPGVCTALPITDIAIRRLEQLAKDEGQPLIQDSNLLVEWRPDQLFDPDEYDPDYESDASDSDDDSDTLDASFDPVADDELAQLADPPAWDPPTGPPPLLPFPAPVFAAVGADPVAAAAADAPAFEEAGADPVVEAGAAAPVFAAADTDAPAFEEAGAEPVVDAGAAAPVFANANADPVADFGAAAPYFVAAGADLFFADAGTNAPAPDDVNAAAPTSPTHPDADVSVPSYTLRPARDRSYAHRFAARMDQPHSSQSYDGPGAQLFHSAPSSPPLDPSCHLTSTLTGIMFHQMSASAGIRKHGDAARDALRKEFRQMVDKRVYTPLRRADLTPAQRKHVLRAVNVIKEKRCGKLKGRHCADGSIQRDWYDKHDTSSPTLSIDSLFLSLLIDAREGRDVATADIAGAYLNADMDEFVVLRLTGEDVTLMCQVSPEFSAFVDTEHNRQVLYLRLDKALYGCVRSALLWYRLFTDTLAGMGFELNPYDTCVANATIDGRQCTVAWYVDDNKISHVNSLVVDHVIASIEAKFGVMSKTRGRSHEFLGMNITFLDDHKVQINMSRYLKAARDSSRLNISRTAATPAAKTLYDVDASSPLLPPDEATTFHRVVSQLLYVGLRGRPDLLVALCFLSTRVTCPTEQDQRKLRRLLEYIHGTLNLVLTIGALDLSTLYTFVDAAYGVHPDMRSQTGGVTSFGHGGIICRASKQKLNTKSSTEAELIGASDYMSNTLWVHHFMEAQGYPIRTSFFEQDNESAIKLARNGRASAGQRSRHINIRHFWIKDCLEQDHITMRHCDTESMLADFLTKPLQGTLFRKFRDVILGYQPLSLLGRVGPVLDMERVEGNPSSARATTKQVSWSDIVRGSQLGEAGDVASNDRTPTPPQAHSVRQREITRRFD